MDRTEEFLKATQLFQSIQPKSLDTESKQTKNGENLSKFLQLSMYVSNLLDGDELLVRRMQKL